MGSHSSKGTAQRSPSKKKQKKKTVFPPAKEIREESSSPEGDRVTKLLAKLTLEQKVCSLLIYGGEV